MSTLSAHALTYEIDGTRLVDEVNLQIGAGELVALAGPNGAGKSTLIRLLAGELTPTSGYVDIDGHRLAQLDHCHRGLLRSVMPQETALHFAFTVRQVVDMGRHPHRRTATKEEHQSAVEYAIHATEIEPFAERTFPTLSGGERARTTLARVVAQNTPILLLDEPVAALDIRHQERAMRIARSLADAGGTVVAALHDLNLAAAYADRIALLDRGRLAACGSPRAILTRETLSAVFDYPIDVVSSAGGSGLVVLPERDQRPGAYDADFQALTTASTSLRASPRIMM